MNPIIAAVDAGHFFQTVDTQQAKLHVDWQVGEQRCRFDHQVWPCIPIMEARKQAGPVQSDSRSRISSVPTFLPPKP